MGGDAVEHVHALGLRIGLPASLAEIGVAQADLRAMAEASFGIKRLIDNNPRPLDVDALEAILDAAWHGEPGAPGARSPPKAHRASSSSTVARDSTLAALA